MPRALVTGATAGIGAEFALQLAQAGYALVIVARDGKRLDATATALRNDHRVDVEIIRADLTIPAEIATVAERLRSEEAPIDLLVNNAGFGLAGAFAANDLSEELDQLSVLVSAPLILTHAATGRMLERGGGGVIMVASIAGYLPMGTYSAAKAWVLSFTRWANSFYKTSGITVTAVAPGFVHTEFHDRMRVSKAAIPEPLWLTAPFVVRRALRDHERAKAISIPSVRYRILVAILRHLPARMLAYRAFRRAL